MPNIPDFHHYGIELLRIAEKKGMPHDHALSLYRTYEKNLKDGWTFGDAVSNLKYSIFYYLYPTIELSWGNIICDKCDRVIVYGEDRVIKNELITWCMGCEKELQEKLAERRRLEEEEKERKRLAEEERKKSFGKYSNFI